MASRTATGTHLDSTTTFPLSIVGSTSYITQIAFAWKALAAGWFVKVQDKDTPSKSIVSLDLTTTGVLSTATPNEQVIYYHQPIQMLNGIQITSTSIAAGSTLDIWISFDQSPAGSGQ